ncbi:hypothetical protein [Undibacterium terreum]|nr:hypothetical protein [Undibacterium terreum]
MDKAIAAKHCILRQFRSTHKSGLDKLRISKYALGMGDGAGLPPKKLMADIVQVGKRVFIAEASLAPDADCGLESR